MTVHWRFVNSTSRLNFALEGDTSGWMALGFGVAANMGPGDAIICSLPGGTATVVDYRILGFADVGVDTASGGTDDVIAGFSGSSANGNRLFEFSRNLTTSDANDYQFDPSGGQTVPIVLAFSTSDYIAGGHIGRTRANVGFFADPTTGVSTGVSTAAIAGTTGTTQACAGSPLLTFCSQLCASTSVRSCSCINDTPSAVCNEPTSAVSSALRAFPRVPLGPLLVVLGLASSCGTAFAK